MIQENIGNTTLLKLVASNLLSNAADFFFYILAKTCRGGQARHPEALRLGDFARLIIFLEKAQRPVCRGGQGAKKSQYDGPTNLAVLLHLL